MIASQVLPALMNRTRLTKKAQTTVPKHIREHLGIGPGDAIEWRIVDGRVVVDSGKRVGTPADVLLSTKVKLGADAVKLVQEAREKIA